MLRRSHIIPFLFFVPFFLTAESISYFVNFEGVEDSAMLKELKNISSLSSLKKRPPASINALRYRADSDIPELVKVLHAHGYYDATVKIRIDDIKEKAAVVVSIDLGSVYTIADYTIRLYSGNFENPIECPMISLDKIGIALQNEVDAKEILEAELKLLELLSICGYPLATIDKREILADSETKTLHINIEIDAGPLAKFGDVSICTDGNVKPHFIFQKITWSEGEIYNSKWIESTQKTLMDTGLFCSVLITHENALTEEGQLNMNIELTESKHRSISFGASYQTFYGVGGTFNWENRNIGGMGRKLSFQGDVTHNSHTGIGGYIIPMFYRPNQDFIINAEAGHESIYPYSERTYNVVNRIERRVGENLRWTAGGEIERLYITDSAANGHYVLFEIPFYIRWSTVDDFLNPSKGITFEYAAEATMNFQKINTYYLLQQFVHANYLTWGAFTLAQQVTLGSILSEELSAIPLSKRYLGGSENELRGYRYRTVSPLNSHNKPLGGRSAIYYTAELRFRVLESMGLVPFFDIGNVEFNVFPPFTGKWFKSIGLGYRYFSFFGPIRLDVAVPLDRRHHIDPTYRVLVSIGQTF